MSQAESNARLMLRETALACPHSLTYAASSLRGVNPGGLSVEQPAKFDLVSLKAAKALDLTIPPSILV